MREIKALLSVSFVLLLAIACFAHASHRTSERIHELRARQELLERQMLLQPASRSECCPCRPALEPEWHSVEL
jgi:hypothetical protein